MNPRAFSFLASAEGPWQILSNVAVKGAPLASAARLNVLDSYLPALPENAAWLLRGVTSNSRYVTDDEKRELLAKQAPIGRAECTRAALIPIRKNAAWWDLAQSERRAIFEERSHHTRASLKYLPAIARRLHRCRDLAIAEPFDFLTFFDYQQRDSEAFEELVGQLRRSEEWQYVEREVDIRLAR